MSDREAVLWAQLEQAERLLRLVLEGPVVQGRPLTAGRLRQAASLIRAAKEGLRP